MAASFSFGRVLGGLALLLALGAAASAPKAAHAKHFLTHPAAAPLVAPRAAEIARPAAPAKPVKPLVVKTARSVPNPAKLFDENRDATKNRNDANVIIKPSFLPKNDELLEAYATPGPATANNAKAPGLLGIATQAYRVQTRKPAAVRTAPKAYSLADAMRDAVWRKKTAARLKAVMQ